MLKKYFKATFRNLWKNKGDSLLNIGGPAIGIACAALIFLWVEDELTYNHYFSNRNNLYKVKDRQTYDGTTFVFDATPGPFANGIKAEISGIKNTPHTAAGHFRNEPGVGTCHYRPHKTISKNGDASSRVETVFKKYNPSSPFEYKFTDDAYA